MFTSGLTRLNKNGEVLRMKTGLGGHRSEVSWMIKSVHDLIQSNRRVTVNDIARTLSLSVGTAHRIAQDDLGHSKVSCPWVPKMLTVEHRGGSSCPSSVSAVMKRMVMSF